MQRIPKNRAEAESAVETAINELLVRRGGEVGLEPQVFAPAFWPLARFLYREEIEARRPFSSRDPDGLVQLLQDAASKSVDVIVSPDVWDQLAADNPHDEWW